MSQVPGVADRPRDRDKQEAAARTASLESMPAAEIAERLRDLAGIWDAAPASRRAIAERIEVRSTTQALLAVCGSPMMLG